MCMANNVTVKEHDQKISDDYRAYLKAVEEKIDSYDASDILFVAEPSGNNTKKTNLFDIFLNTIPESDRQHYNCNTCRSFFHRYGWLVTVNSTGDLNPVVWPDSLPEDNFFCETNNKIREIITRAKVESDFNGVPMLGKQYTPEYPDFIHFYGNLHKIKRSSADFQINTELVGDFLRYSSYERHDRVEAAINILNNPLVLLREKYIDMAEKYLTWIKIFETTKNSVHKNNLAFKFLAENPTLLHVRQSMLGMMLSDIDEGFSEEMIIDRFNEKTDPEVYAKKTAEASVRNLIEANRIINEMNLESALYRRIAYADEVKAIWRKGKTKESEEKNDSRLGIFDKINPEKKQYKKEENWGDRGVVSILQLVEMLDQIDRIFIKIPDLDYLGGITCPAREGAGNLLRHYPYGEESNQFSTYFYNGTCTYTSPTWWNDFNINKYYEVNTLCWKPTHWDVELPERKGFEQYDRTFGLMFLLDGLKDTHPKVIAPIFENTIRSDIRSKVGRAVYQLTCELPLEGADGDPSERQMAFGLCYDGPATFRVPARLIMKTGERISLTVCRFK